MAGHGKRLVAWALPGQRLTMSLFETNVSRVSQVSAILIFDYYFLFYACAWSLANSAISLAKIVTYYSQNYASILDTSLNLHLKAPTR